MLRHLGIATSSWYRPKSAERKRPGPAPKPIPQDIVDAVITMATDNPWYGYKRIAVMCRRAGQAVKNRVAYLVMRKHHLLHRRRSRAAEVYQAARLFELLPRQPNDLWQMDVTYIHIPGHGWWYAVTVIGALGAVPRDAEVRGGTLRPAALDEARKLFADLQAQLHELRSQLNRNSSNSRDISRFYS